MEKPRLAFIGLGAMGFGMASNLLTRAFSVRGYDVSPSAVSALADLGGERASSPAHCVAGARWVVLMVATAAQAMSVLFDPSSGAVEGLEKGAVVLCCSTGPLGYVPLVRERLDALDRADVFVVDAPVSGGTIRARSGELTILASGDASAVEAAKMVLDAMAAKEKLYIIPGGLGAGTKAKLVHQVLAGVHIVMAAEGMGFARALGLDPRSAFERLKTSEGSSWMLENRAPHLLDEDPVIHSAMDIIVKDVVSNSLAHRCTSN